MSSQSRPAKRARITEKASQTAQPNNQRHGQVQVQHSQRTSVDLNNGHNSTHPINAAQGAIDPSQGAIDPTLHDTNNNNGFVQQNQETSLPLVFGQNNQANFDPNFGGFAQEFQPIRLPENSLFPDQIDGANNLSSDAVTNQNTGLELAQSQSDMSNGWMEFLNSNSMDGFDPDFSYEQMEAELAPLVRWNAEN